MSDAKSLVVRARTDLVRVDFRAFQATVVEATAKLAAVNSTYNDLHRSAKDLPSLYAQNDFWDVLERLCVYKAVLNPPGAQDDLAPMIVEILFGDKSAIDRLVTLFHVRGGGVPQLDPTLVFLARVRDLRGRVLLEGGAADKNAAGLVSRSLRNGLQRAVRVSGEVAAPWSEYLMAMEAVCAFNDRHYGRAHECVTSARRRLGTLPPFQHLRSIVSCKFAEQLIVSQGAREQIEELLGQSVAEEENDDARIALQNYYWSIGDTSAQRSHALEALAKARSAWSKGLWEIELADLVPDDHERIARLDQLRERWSANDHWVDVSDGKLVNALMHSYDCVRECHRGSWVLAIDIMKCQGSMNLMTAKGIYLAGTGRAREGVECLQKALTLTNSVTCKADLSMRIARIYESLGLRDEALQTARGVLAMYPGFDYAEEVVFRLRGVVSRSRRGRKA